MQNLFPNERFSPFLIGSGSTFSATYFIPKEFIPMIKMRRLLAETFDVHPMFRVFTGASVVTILFEIQFKKPAAPDSTSQPLSFSVTLRVKYGKKVHEETTSSTNTAKAREAQEPGALQGTPHSQS